MRPVVFLAEEYAVALPANHGAHAARRIRFLRVKKEAALVGRPFNGRTCLDEISPEIFRFIDNCLPVDFATPFNVERHGRLHWSYGRYRRIVRGQSLTVSQRVCQVVGVWNRKAVDMQRGPGCIEFNFEAIRIHGDRPK